MTPCVIGSPSPPLCKYLPTLRARDNDGVARARPAAGRLVGLDQSEIFLAIARNELASAEFIRHDITKLPWPVAGADLAFARYLLNHLPNPGARLQEWAAQVRLGGVVAIEDDVDMQSPNPVLAEYTKVVNEVLAASGAELFVVGRCSRSSSAWRWSWTGWSRSDRGQT